MSNARIRPVVRDRSRTVEAKQASMARRAERQRIVRPLDAARLEAELHAMPTTGAVAR